MANPLRTLEHFAKEGIESVVRTVVRTSAGRAPVEAADLLEQVAARGFAVVEGFWDRARCQAATDQIERELASGERHCHHWVDKLGSDNRLYHSEKLGGALREYFEDPSLREMRRLYTGFSGGARLLLSARLCYVPGNLGSGGGWHRDSPHRSQFKTILYLSDVARENGPFEFIAGTHEATDSLRMLRQGVSRPNQYRYTNDEVAAILAQDREATTFLGAAGTLLLVDTKGIHRGRPIEAGKRFALTTYYWDKNMPSDFLT
jgi:hypothetical protein